MKESVRKQLPDMIKRRPQRSPFSFCLFGCDRVQFQFSLCCSDAGPVKSGYWQIIEDLPSLSDK